MPLTRLLRSSGLGMQRLAAGEGEEAGGEGGGAGGAVERVVDQAAAAVVWGAAAEQVEAAHDDGEEVVEVVGEAAGELSDGFHLLRLVELLLGGGAGGHLVAQALVGGLGGGGAFGDLVLQVVGEAGLGLAGAHDLVDVDEGGDGAGEGAVRVGDGGGDDADPGLRAVAAGVEALQLRPLLSAEDVGDGEVGGAHGAAVGVVGLPFAVVAEGAAALERVAEHGAEVAVAGHDAAGAVRDDDAYGHRLDDGGELGAFGGEGVRAVAQVLGGADEGAGHAVDLGDAGADGFDGEAGAEVVAGLGEAVEGAGDGAGEQPGEQAGDGQGDEAGGGEPAEGGVERGLDGAHGDADADVPAGHAHLLGGDQQVLAFGRAGGAQVVVGGGAGEQARGGGPAEDAVGVEGAGEGAAVAVHHGGAPAGGQALGEQQLGQIERAEIEGEDVGDLSGDDDGVHDDDGQVAVGGAGEEVGGDGLPGADRLVEGGHVGHAGEGGVRGEPGVEELLAVGVAEDEGLVGRGGGAGLDGEGVEVAAGEGGRGGEGAEGGGQVGELAVQGLGGAEGGGGGDLLGAGLLDAGDAVDQDAGEEQAGEDEGEDDADEDGADGPATPGCPGCGDRCGAGGCCHGLGGGSIAFGWAEPCSGAAAAATRSRVGGGRPVRAGFDGLL